MASRTFAAVAIGIVLLPAALSDRRPVPPTVRKDAVEIRQVFKGKLSAQEPTDGLVVEWADGVGTAESGVFLVNGETGEAQRVPVRFGRAVPPLLEVVSGVSAGDRIIVSDLSAWDQFDRLRLR